MTNTLKILNDRRGLALLLAVTWFSYFSTYLGRLNFSACMGEMVINEGFRKTHLGTIAASFYFSYGLGQVISGILGDHFPPRVLVTVGLTGSALMNLLFSFVNNPGIMAVLWFVNGLMQSLIWAPLSRYVSDRTSGTQCVRIMLLLSTTSPAGMLCAYAASAALLHSTGWRACLWGAAIILFVVSAFWYFGSAFIDRYTDRHGVEDTPAAIESVKIKADRSEAIAIIIKFGFVWIFLAVFLQGFLKDGLTTWIPTYFTETFNLAPSFSVILTTVLPVANLSGVYLANLFNRRIFCNEALTSLTFFLLAAAAIICMILPIGSSISGSLVLFAVITSCMTAVNTVFISLVPIHFRRLNAVSTVSGTLGAVTYLGSSFSSIAFGSTSEIMGWEGPRIIWCLIAVLGAFSCFMAIWKWGRFRQNIYGKDFAE